MSTAVGQVIPNPQCPLCGAIADGILDRSLSNDGYYICPNLNCEHEWKPGEIAQLRDGL
jgi:hypothetical protein